jgi:hypothetical protein
MMQDRVFPLPVKSESKKIYTLQMLAARSHVPHIGPWSIRFLLCWLLRGGIIDHGFPIALIVASPTAGFWPQ